MGEGKALRPSCYRKATHARRVRKLQPHPRQRPPAQRDPPLRRGLAANRSSPASELGVPFQLPATQTCLIVLLQWSPPKATRRAFAAAAAAAAPFAIILVAAVLLLHTAPPSRPPPLSHLSPDPYSMRTGVKTARLRTVPYRQRRRWAFATFTQAVCCLLHSKRRSSEALIVRFVRAWQSVDDHYSIVLLTPDNMVNLSCMRGLLRADLARKHATQPGVAGLAASARSLQPVVSLRAAVCNRRTPPTPKAPNTLNAPTRPSSWAADETEQAPSQRQSGNSPSQGNTTAAGPQICRAILAWRSFVLSARHTKTPACTR